MCKILVQNFITKDILKKKNDVHWISVRTIVYVAEQAGFSITWLQIQKKDFLALSPFYHLYYTYTRAAFGIFILDQHERMCEYFH